MGDIINFPVLAQYLKYFLAVYLAVVSVIAVGVCIFDKLQAKKHKRRIPESDLMLVGALGGALPMFITMLIIRHKTKHAKFMAGLPAMILLQAAIVFLICFNG